jgi:hypothetical protein
MRKMTDIMDIPSMRKCKCRYCFTDDPQNFGLRNNRVCTLCATEKQRGGHMPGDLLEPLPVPVTTFLEEVEANRVEILIL